MRWRRVLGAAAGLLVILAVGGYLLRDQWLGPRLSALLEQAIEENLGLRASVGTVRGTYFTSVEVVDLRATEGATPGPLVAFSLARAKIQYQPWSLVGGIDGFLASTRVELEDASLEVDLERVPPQAEEDTQELGELVLPKSLPRVRVSGFDGRVRGPGWAFEWEDLSVRSGPDGGSQRAALEVGRVGWVLPVLQDGSGPAEAQLVYTGNSVSLESVRFGDASLVEEISVGLAEVPERVPVRARLTVLGGMWDLQGVLAGSEIVARVDAQGVELGEVLSLLEAPPVMGTGAVTFGAALRLDPQDLAGVDATVDLSAADLRIQGASVERVGVQARAVRREVRVDAVDVFLGANEVHATATGPLEPLLEGDVGRLAQESSAEVRLRLEDIPGLLALLGIEPLPGVPPLGHDLELEAEVAQGVLTVSRGVLRTDRGAVTVERGVVELPGPDRPPHAVDVDAAVAVDLPELAPVAALFGVGGVGGSLAGRVAVRGTPAELQGDLTLRGSGLELRGVSVGDLAARAEADAQEFRLQELEVEGGVGRLRVQGVLDLAARRARDVDVHLRVPELAPLVRLLPEPVPTIQGEPLRLAGDVTFRGVGEGTLDALRASGDLEVRGLEVQGEPLGQLSARASFAAPRFRIEVLDWVRGPDRIAAAGALDLSTQELSDVELDVRVGDLAAWAAGLVPEAWGLSGSVEAKAGLGGPLLFPRGQMEVRGSQLRYGGVTVSELDVNVRSDGSEVDLEMRELVSSEGAAHLAATVRGEKRWRSLSGTLKEFGARRGGLTAELIGPATFSASRGGDVAVRDFELALPEGTVAVHGDLRPSGRSDLRLTLSGVSSRGWLEEWVGDRIVLAGVDATVRFEGSAEEPLVEASGSVQELSGPDAPFPFRGAFDARFQDERLEVRQLDWEARGGQALRFTGSIPLDPAGDLLAPGPITLDGVVELPALAALSFLTPPEVTLAGSLTAVLTARGTWARPEGRLTWEARDVALPVPFQPAPPGPFAARGDLSLHQTAVELSSLQVESPALKVDARGRWDDPPWEDLLAGRWEERSGPVTANLTLVSPEVGWAADGVDALRRVGGRLECELAVAGTVRDPRWLGSVRVTGGEVRATGPATPVEALELRAIVDSAGAWIEHLTGELGGGPFQVQGTVGLGSGKPEVDLSLKGQNLLLFRNEGVKVRADAELAVAGPVEELEIAGTLGLTEGRFVKNVELGALFHRSGAPKAGGAGLQLFSFPSPPLRDAVFDIRITSRQPFRIKNNVARGGVRPELLLKGTGEVPVLTGEVYLDPIRISLPAGRLTVESGVVRFLEGAPDRPVIDLTAGTRMMGYDVTIQVNGPYDEPTVTLSSVPPLPDDELLLLVLAGTPPRSQMNGDAGRGSGLMVATYLGRGLLGDLFGDESTESDESIVDRFELEVGRGVTRRGDETIEATFRLAEGVFLRGDTVYVRAEKDIYDAFNTGVRFVFRFR